MLKDLIEFFESAPLEEVTKKLKDSNVKFTSDIAEKYDNIMKNINVSKENKYFYVTVKSKFNNDNNLNDKYNNYLRNCNYYNNLKGSCEINNYDEDIVISV